MQIPKKFSYNVFSYEEIHAELTISSGGEWQIKLHAHIMHIWTQYIGRAKSACINGVFRYKVYDSLPDDSWQAVFNR